MTLIKRINVLPRWIIATIDGAILFHSAILAYYIRLNFEWAALDQFRVWEGALLFLCIGLSVMYFTKSYVGIVRHTRIRDGKTLFRTILYTAAIAVLVNFLSVSVGIDPIIPNSVVVIASLLAMVTLVFYRVLVKEMFGRWAEAREEKELKRVIIFGAGQAGLLAHDVIKKDRQSLFVNCGFLDDDPKKQGKIIDGVMIYGGEDALESLVKSKKVTDLILSIQDISGQRKRQIFDKCLSLNLHVSIFPPVDQWVNGGLEPGSIREVKIEDLLSRDMISLDNEKVRESLNDKVILVTGAAGSIGSELCRQIVHYSPKLLILLDQAESALYDVEQDIKASGYSNIEVVLADVRNRKKVSEVFKRYKPEVVFHAAAYKHVPMMEKYPEEAVKCNIMGTKLLADISVLHNVEKFVLVSTDKAVNPTNVMGATKRIAEMYVQALNGYLAQNESSKSTQTKFITTRFGNVLGSNGSVIPLFRKQIMKGGPLTVTDPRITRYFMTIPEACELVLEAGVMGNGGEIYVFDMGQPVKIIDLAKRMIQLSGKKLNEDIKIAFTGLREGEKLYEELLNDSEISKVTHHPKIKIASVKQVSYMKVDEQIEYFDHLLVKSSENDLVSHLKLMVPEYISNASRFGALDKMDSMVN